MYKVARPLLLYWEYILPESTLSRDEITRILETRCKKEQSRKGVALKGYNTIEWRMKANKKSRIKLKAHFTVSFPFSRVISNIYKKIILRFVIEKHDKEALA